jgi:uncharacterized phage-associated protein
MANPTEVAHLAEYLLHQHDMGDPCITSHSLAKVLAYAQAAYLSPNRPRLANRLRVAIDDLEDRLDTIEGR